MAPPEPKSTGLKDAASIEKARVLAKKVQTRMNLLARAGESDRREKPKLTKHLNVGKRRQGTKSHR
jgi:hypothetical protein